MLKLSPELQQIDCSSGHYLVRFVTDNLELDQVARVRFNVFNQELNAGSDASSAIERDLDKYDESCHHLMLIDQKDNRVVGTYRMQTYDMARQYHGFYSSEEFDLSSIPSSVIDDAVEIGRACILKEYRSWRTFILLWQGIAAYLQCQNKCYLFGCSSLMSQDIAEGYAVLEYLRKNKMLHQDFWVNPTYKYKCLSESIAYKSLTVKQKQVELPKLLQFYLKFGARVCSNPAIDRAFKSIDFFTIFNIKDLRQKHSAFYVAG